jgi:cation transporter-like permease
MILVLAYCAVLLSFASGLLAQMMNQRHNLSALSQYLPGFHAVRGNETKLHSGECKNPQLQPLPNRAD